MILDELKNRHRYRSDAKLSAFLDYFATLDPANPPTEQVSLGEGLGQVNPGSFTTRTPEECKFEAHQRYADVHYVLSGRERIEVAALGELSTVTQYDAEADVSFHEGAARVSFVLEPGWFLVCFPDDAHKPGMQVSGPEQVAKVVGKLLCG